MAMRQIENDPVTEKRMRDFAQTLSEKDRRRFAAIEAAQRGYGGAEKVGAEKVSGTFVWSNTAWNGISEMGRTFSMSVRSMATAWKSLRRAVTVFTRISRSQ